MTAVILAPDGTEVRRFETDAPEYAKEQAARNYPAGYRVEIRE